MSNNLDLRFCATLRLRVKRLSPLPCLLLAVSAALTAQTAPPRSRPAPRAAAAATPSYRDLKFPSLRPI